MVGPGAFDLGNGSGGATSIFGEGAFDIILSLLKNKSIRRFDIFGRSAGITAAQAQVIADALRANPNLECLALGGSIFDYDGAIIILDALVNYGFNLSEVSMPSFFELLPETVVNSGVTDSVRPGNNTYLSSMNEFYA